jgi:hypothetical protein
MFAMRPLMTMYNLFFIVLYDTQYKNYKLNQDMVFVAW